MNVSEYLNYLSVLNHQVSVGTVLAFLAVLAGVWFAGRRVIGWGIALVKVVAFSMFLSGIFAIGGIGLIAFGIGGFSSGAPGLPNPEFSDSNLVDIAKNGKDESTKEVLEYAKARDTKVREYWSAAHETVEQRREFLPNWFLSTCIGVGIALGLCSVVTLIHNHG